MLAVFVALCFAIVESAETTTWAELAISWPLPGAHLTLAPNEPIDVKLELTLHGGSRYLELVNAVQSHEAKVCLHVESPGSVHHGAAAPAVCTPVTAETIQLPARFGGVRLFASLSCRGFEPPARSGTVSFTTSAAHTTTRHSETGAPSDAPEASSDDCQYRFVGLNVARPTPLAPPQCTSYGLAQRDEPRRVFVGFAFSSELDVLELHLAELCACVLQCIQQPGPHACTPAAGCARLSTD
jgi:hypothetical protein